MTLAADGCVLHGFRIMNSGIGFAGVLSESNYNRIFQNVIVDNHEGLYLNYSSHNVILANNISYNRNENIYIFGGAHNIIGRNLIGLMAGPYGILARNSQRNFIFRNEIVYVGIYRYNSSWDK